MLAQQLKNSLVIQLNLILSNLGIIEVDIIRVPHPTLVLYRDKVS